MLYNILYSFIVRRHNQVEHWAVLVWDTMTADFRMCTFYCDEIYYDYYAYYYFILYTQWDFFFCIFTFFFPCCGASWLPVWVSIYKCANVCSSNTTNSSFFINFHIERRQMAIRMWLELFCRNQELLQIILFIATISISSAFE